MKDVKSQLISIFGSSNVTEDRERLRTYIYSKNFVKGIMPYYEVIPQNADQIEQLVKLANNMRIPLIPVSSTGKHRHGGSAPAVPEAIVVNLSQMKRVISVNPLFRIAVIEPGITYGELKEKLAPHGLTISMPLAPRAEKSVVASLLETEPRLDPNTQWNSLDPLRCTEVIWGDGHRMYTGDAGMGPRDVTAQQKNDNWQIVSTGPDMVDYIRLLTGSQGTMGIVSWASVKCAQIPDVEEHFLVPSDSLEGLIDFMYNVEHIRFGNCLFALNRTALALLMGTTPGEVDALRRSLPAWIGVVSSQSRRFAPELRVKAHSEGIAQCAARAGVEITGAVDRLTAKAVHDRAFSVCEPGKYWKDTLKGDAADILFSTTMDKTPGFVEAVNKKADELGYAASDIGVYIQPMHQGVNCHCEFILPYDGSDGKDMALTARLFEEASKRLSEMNAYFYRPYGRWSAIQLSKDAMTAATLRKLKNIFDPNEVLNPSKLRPW